MTDKNQVSKSIQAKFVFGLNGADVFSFGGSCFYDATNSNIDLNMRLFKPLFKLKFREE